MNTRRDIGDTSNLNVSLICGVIKEAEFGKILPEMSKDSIYREGELNRTEEHS
ncbi:MAG: hypothetical protein QXQ46_11175 [Thermoplasmatales archaeon]